MGVILDSSVVIAAERRGDNVTQMLKQIVAATGDQRAVLSSVGLTELVHGIYRAQTAQARSRRDSFIRELLNDVEVYPYTKRDSAHSRQDRWRTAEPGNHHPFRRSVDRSHGAGGGLLPADRQRAPLRANPRPVCSEALATGTTARYFGWRLLGVGLGV